MQVDIPGAKRATNLLDTATSLCDAQETVGDGSVRAIFEFACACVTIIFGNLTCGTRGKVVSSYRI